MNHKLPALMLLLLFSAASTPAAAGDSPLPTPGRYEVSTHTSYIDVAIPDTTITTRNCLTEEDLQAGAATIFAGLPEDQNCEVSDFVMAEGNISMTLSCAAPDGDMHMVTSGTYTPDGYNMTSKVTVSVGDSTVEMRSEIVGTLVGDC
jgi:hypothetical protein